MRPYYSSALLVCLIALLSWGCGGDDQPENPEQPKGVPSPTAKENNWPENELFGSVPPYTNYDEDGWVGNWDSIGTPFETMPLDSTLTPCGVTTNLMSETSVGDTLNCDGPIPDFNGFQGMCEANRDKLESLCERLCLAIQPACPNWQLQPHIYEEWGCVPFSKYWCLTVEGCRCSESPA